MRRYDPDTNLSSSLEVTEKLIDRIFPRVTTGLGFNVMI